MQKAANPSRYSNANTAGLQTLRYGGFPEFVKVLVDIGFLSDEEQSFLNEPITWKEATQKILDAPSSSEKDLLWAISSKTTFKDNDEENQLMAGLKWGKQPCVPSYSHSWSLLGGVINGLRCKATCYTWTPKTSSQHPKPSSRSNTDTAAQLASSRIQRLPQKEIRWILCVPLLKKRCSSRRVSVT